MDSGVRYMHTRVGQILRSLFWTFLIHTANVSSFEHAVALKVPYYQPYVSMIWLLSYFELNCTAWPSNWGDDFGGSNVVTDVSGLECNPRGLG